MSSKQIKILVLVLSTIFLLSLINSFLNNKQDEKLLNTQIEISQNYLIKKDATLELNNAYRSSFINYDKLLRANQTLFQDIQRLTIKYPEQLKIKKIKEILFKQNQNVDLIKRANSIVTNSLYYITYLSSKVLSDTIYKNKQEIIELRKLTRNLVNLSYNIKLADKSIFQKYKKTIDKLKKIKITNPKLLVYQQKLIFHTTTILKYAKSMHQNIDIFNNLEQKSNDIYLKIKEELENKHLEAKQNIRFMQITLVVLLFIFVMLIARFLKLENNYKKDLEELNETQKSTIEEQTKIANSQRDKALEAVKSKDIFLANMSHEIRTPLNAIIGFIGLLQENEQDKTKQNYLNIINSSSKNLLEIINDILDFSKIESGKLEIDKIDFNPTDEFDLTQKLFQARFKEKNIEFKVTYKNLPNSLNGDIFRMKQVINNLLSNAIKFTPNSKKIYLDIEYKNNNLFVNIKDQGIGISKEYQDKIFDAFSQEDSSTTRKYGGTGLGLTISYNLVKAMGGELKVKSEVGVGSEFYFSIPVKIGKELKKENTNIKEFDFSDKKILLVEDNKANQAFMKVLFKKLNLSFDIANDGVEAVELCKQNHDIYDAILMDENMPNMNGIEATRQILECEKQNSLVHTPIVALTANALKGDKERFLEVGMDEYLAKPLERKKLSEILGKFL